VKLSVPPERILPVIERIKTGIRGVGYVRLDDSAAWPERLDRPLPERPAVPAPTAPKPEGGKVAESQGAPPATPAPRS
jgi:HlyD family secretion protein